MLGKIWHCPTLLEGKREATWLFCHLLVTVGSSWLAFTVVATATITFSRQVNFLAFIHALSKEKWTVSGRWGLQMIGSPSAAVSSPPPCVCSQGSS